MGSPSYEKRLHWGMTWTPKGWWTPSAITPAHLRIDMCQCLRCTIDGQHNLLCEVHLDPPKVCDCARSDMPESAPAATKHPS
jgi:hypothetical protein